MRREKKYAGIEKKYRDIYGWYAQPQPTYGYFKQAARYKLRDRVYLASPENFIVWEKKK